MVTSVINFDDSLKLLTKFQEFPHLHFVLFITGQQLLIIKTLQCIFYILLPQFSVEICSFASAYNDLWSQLAKNLSEADKIDEANFLQLFDLLLPFFSFRYDGYQILMIFTKKHLKATSDSQVAFLRFNLLAHFMTSCFLNCTSTIMHTHPCTLR